MKAVWISLCLLASGAAWAQQYVISTVAGGVLSQGYGDYPSLGITADAAGNVYFASSQLNSIFRRDSNGVITRVAGNPGSGSFGDGGPAVEAKLNSPSGVAVDSAGNLLIADTGNRRIRKVSPDGIIVTVVGNGTCCFSGDSGPATNAQLQTPTGVAVDAEGNLFVADEYGQRIRKVSISGIITTVAGTGSVGFSGDGGAAAAAQLNYPFSVALDRAGNLFIADYGNRRVRKVSPSGIIMTVLGNAPAQLANGPLSVAFDAADNMLVADYSHVLRVSSGIVSTVAGGGSLWGSSADGGPATGAALLPYAVTPDGSGNLFLVDSLGPSVREVSTRGIISTAVSAFIPCCGNGDGGPALQAQLNNPAGIALDGVGNFYIADAFNMRIRKVSTGGVMTTVASGCGLPDDYDAPCGIAVDSAGSLFVSDGSGVKKISPDGTSIQVSAEPSYGIAVDKADNLYIADQFACRIRRVSKAGEMTSVAGNGTCGYSGDGGPATSAQLFDPLAVAVDRAGNVYFVDEGLGLVRIRRVSPDGIITTVAGGGSGDMLDGSVATSGKLHELIGLAADDAGNVYFQEFSVFYPDYLVPRRVVKISPDGIVTTIAGSGDPGYCGDGGPAILALLNPRADERGNNLGVDSAGNVYVADAGNNAIRLLRPINQPSISAVVDAASQRRDPVSPGKIVVIGGTLLGPSELIQNQSDNGRIGTELGGTVVSINGIAAPILYTSATQVASIAPYAIASTTAQVTVTYQGRVSAAFPVDVAPSAPSLFTFNETGAGQATAVNAVNGTANTAANPAKIGDYISLYATGEGQTIPAGVDGKLGGPALTHPVLTVSATVGGLPATVQYAGGVPGQVAGLMQVNVQIPSGVQPGGYVPVVLKVGDRTSGSAVWIAVSGN